MTTVNATADAAITALNPTATIPAWTTTRTRSRQWRASVPYRKPPGSLTSGVCVGDGMRQYRGVPTHVALLRGINVGGRNRVAMADLREVVTSLGHTEVATYIQSGNVVFTSKEADTMALAAALERAIAGALTVRPRVVVLSRNGLAQVIADNPFPDETNPQCLHTAFGSEELGPGEVTAVAVALQRAREKGSRDEAQVVGRTLFLRTPDGLGRSKLAAQLARPGGALAGLASATMRNWATVRKLLAMCDT